MLAAGQGDGAARRVDGERIVARVDQLDLDQIALRDMARDGAEQRALQVAGDAAAEVRWNQAGAGLLRVGDHR